MKIFKLKKWSNNSVHFFILMKCKILHRDAMAEWIGKELLDLFISVKCFQCQ